MMITMELDEQTAEQLQALSAASGLTPAEFLKRLFPVVRDEVFDRLNAEQWDHLVGELAFDGPSLPADFSRIDIDGEHD
jgi:hypothetical protein